MMKNRIGSLLGRASRPACCASLALMVATLGIAERASAGVCVVPNIGGTASLPPNCTQGYVSPDQLHLIIDGLPPGTEIILDVSHERFDLSSVTPGGNLGGEIEEFASVLLMNMKGTGKLAGFQRSLVVPAMTETHVGPRTPGDPVQSFPTELVRLQGALAGDPDFCQFSVVAGGAFDLPSPGQTTLTQLNAAGGDFAVDSFFDITYQIDFAGCPTGPLAGLAGSTRATVRMQAGLPSIHPGDDLWHTVARTNIEFGGDTIPPIPAGFLCNNSPAFSGLVELRGVPVDPTNLGNTDTIVRRLEPASLPTVGASDTIPIELVAMSLTSVNPVDLGCGVLFDVHVGLQPAPPSGGTMTIVRTHDDGGVFDSDMVVYPRISFSPVGSLSEIVLPFAQPIPLVDDVPNDWVHQCPLDVFPTSGPNFWPIPVPNIEVHPGAAIHTVVPATNRPKPPPDRFGDWRDPNSTAPPSHVTFGLGGEIPPIPADFFGPGSAPFEGVIQLRGRPLDPSTSNATTVLQRGNDPVAPSDPVGTNGYAPVEMVALSLVSVEPIVVNLADGTTSRWDVEVRLSPGLQVVGQVGANKTDPNGGSFSGDFAIWPLFRFTSVANPTMALVMDTRRGMPPLPLFASGDFVHNVDPALGVLVDPLSRWYPGVASTPVGQQLRPVTAQTQDQRTVLHIVCPPVPPPTRCPLPPSPFEPSCDALVARDCESIGTAGGFCMPRAVKVDAGIPFADKCACLTPDDCGAIVIEGSQLSCPGFCPAVTDVCQIHINGQPTGRPKIDSSVIVDGGLVTCECAPPPPDVCMPLEDGSGCADFACPTVSPGAAGAPCIVPNVGGTVVLPPAGCAYLSPNDVHLILDGLPPGTTIKVGASHERFNLTDVTLGGTLGGDVEKFTSALILNMQGTGDLATLARTIVLPVTCEVHTGPRTPGDAVQTFPNEMFLLQGALPPGDPDFESLHIIGGSGNGLPSPGQTTLRRIGPPGGAFEVDSFFDITYRIDFVGLPGGALDGLSGSTTATIRMGTGPGVVDRCQPSCVNFDPQTGAVLVTDCACHGPNDCHVEFGAAAIQPHCVANCPAGFVCVETTTTNADGTVDMCCGCEPAPTGACCLATTPCRETTRDDCLQAGGAFAGEGSMCSGSAESCCLPGGACRMMDPTCCELAQGTPLPGRDCQGRQACCTDTGECVTADGTCCSDAMGGLPLGPDTQCKEPLKCCLPDGQCDLMDPQCCEKLGGFVGSRTLCEPDVGCCLPGGECVNMDPECCRGLDGVVQPNGCTGQVTGCCLPGGQCRDLDPTCCQAAGGEILGEACGPPVGCCLPSDVSGGHCGCIETDPRCCVAVGGEPLGPNDTCLDPPCGRGPFIVHGTAQPGETSPCTGYIDPRIESVRTPFGLPREVGPREFIIEFSEPVFAIGGGPVNVSSFDVRETGPMSGSPPTVSSVVMLNPQLFRVKLSRIISFREWTTIRAKVQDACGDPIINLGDLGVKEVSPGEFVGVPEPDRIDVGRLPADVNQDGEVSPLDLVNLRQFLLANSFHNACDDLLYFDLNRNGALGDPQDLIRFRQMISGTPPATQNWTGQMMNSPQP